MDKYVIQDLFGVEGWNIAWYGVIIAGGMLLGLALAICRAKKEELHSDILFDFFWLLSLLRFCVPEYEVMIKIAAEQKARK